MKNRKIFVRIVALLLALLMAAGVFGIVLQIIAYSADETLLAPVTVAATGSPEGEVKWPVYVAVAAVLVIIICVAVPLISKKK
ncbi:MAG: hypothetical protein ACOYJX_02445 [Acutalibacteraceae bacterium]|jgi:ABC-type Fe3+-siderophore transport system permease subunit